MRHGLISHAYLHFSLQWQGAKPRTPSTPNSVFFGFIIHYIDLELFAGHGTGLSREPYWLHLSLILVWTFTRWHIWTWWSFRSTTSHSMTPPRITVFSFVLHVKGFRSQRIDIKIQFCLVCVCTIWRDVKLLHVLLYVVTGLDARELGTLWLTQFNEARSQSGIFGLAIQTYLQFHHFYSWPRWHGAKQPRTPNTMSLFLHGCLNLVFILFLRHGEGLSREPYCDSLFIYFGFILFHRHWNMRKMLFWWSRSHGPCWRVYVYCQWNVLNQWPQHLHGCTNRQGCSQSNSCSLETFWYGMERKPFLYSSSKEARTEREEEGYSKVEQEKGFWWRSITGRVLEQLGWFWWMGTRWHWSRWFLIFHIVGMETKEQVSVYF